MYLWLDCGFGVGIGREFCDFVDFCVCVIVLCFVLFGGFGIFWQILLLFDCICVILVI